MFDWLTELNDKQKEAVTFSNGPLFVVAGAGTGKTKTLTARIAYLISFQNVNPNRILAVTFTNKAAREMRERLEEMIGDAARGVWIYTFHAFSVQVLKSHIHLLSYGYSNHFNIIDTEDSRQIVREAIDKLELDKKEFKTKEIRNKISYYKTYNDDLAFDNNEEKHIYELYQKKLIESNLLDFDDLIIYTLELLKTNDDVRNKYQEQFEYVLVDEFQDTDFLQYQILYHLANKHKELFVVGDPDQSIYSFRGADYENTRRFLNDFGTKHILDLNYRSTNKILKRANMLINHNSDRPAEKDLYSNLGEGMDVIFSSLQRDYQEASYLVREIDRLVNREGYNYSDIAVLYRSNYLSRAFEDACLQMGIPYIIYGGISFYERKEIKDILAYIRILLNPHNNFYLLRVINIPRRQIGKVTIDKLIHFASENNLSIFESLDKINISAGVNKRLVDFKKLINYMIQKIKGADNLKEVVVTAYELSGYLQMLKDDKDDLSVERIDNIFELENVFFQSEFVYEGTMMEKLQQLLDQISLYTDLDKKHDNEDSVKLSTVHQVKGLEFKVVFITSLEENIFPNERVMFSTKDLEEERRVCYVAVTRAKERLYLSRSETRLRYGMVQSMEPSRFLKEMGVLRVFEPTREYMRTPIEASNNDKIKVGSKISHDIFGVGVLVSLEGEIGTIAFPMPHGIKKININHKTVKPLV